MTSSGKKQQAEIRKMVDKAANCMSYRKLSKEEFDEISKYIVITNKDKDGRNVTPVMGINTEKVEEDLKFAGYNLMVTSEAKTPFQQIYEAYHHLWKIEECFRITKSFLDARPVYLQKRNNLRAFSDMLPQSVSFTHS